MNVVLIKSGGINFGTGLKSVAKIIIRKKKREIRNG